MPVTQEFHSWAESPRSDGMGTREDGRHLFIHIELLDARL